MKKIENEEIEVWEQSRAGGQKKYIPVIVTKGRFLFWDTRKEWYVFINSDTDGRKYYYIREELTGLGLIDERAALAVAEEAIFEHNKRIQEEIDSKIISFKKVHP